MSSPHLSEVVDEIAVHGLGDVLPLAPLPWPICRSISAAGSGTIRDRGAGGGGAQPHGRNPLFAVTVIADLVARARSQRREGGWDLGSATAAVRGTVPRRCASSSSGRPSASNAANSGCSRRRAWPARTSRGRGGGRARRDCDARGGAVCRPGPARSFPDRSRAPQLTGCLDERALRVPARALSGDPVWPSAAGAPCRAASGGRSRVREDPPR